MSQAGIAPGIPQQLNINELVPIKQYNNNMEIMQVE
jgi:hypothetical protein